MLRIRQGKVAELRTAFAGFTVSVPATFPFLQDKRLNPREIKGVPRLSYFWEEAVTTPPGHKSKQILLAFVF